MKTSIGQIYWLQIESDFKHPHFVINIEDDKATVVSITTNQKKANLPGNVILDEGEGGLEKSSIIDVAKVYTVDISELAELIGELNENRVEEVQNGIGFLSRSFYK